MGVCVQHAEMCGIEYLDSGTENAKVEVVIGSSRDGQAEKGALVDPFAVRGPRQSRGALELQKVDGGTV